MDTSLTRRPGDSSSCLTLNSTDGDFFPTKDLGGVDVFRLLLTMIGAGAAYDGPAEMKGNTRRTLKQSSTRAAAVAHMMIVAQ